MEVKNQFKVSILSIKFACMRELLNKTTFISNVLFMILNNASMIIQWIVLFSLKENIGGYSFNQVLLLWGMASGVYGFSRFFFSKSFDLSDIITNGKLDAYIVQPKNVLISVITSDIKVSALGDLIFAFIVLFIYGFTFKRFILFTLFIITGGIIIASVSIILNSLSFWFSKTETVANVGNSLMLNFATYPDGIFKGITKMLLFTLIPVGISNYVPVRIIIEFNIWLFLINIIVCILLVMLAFYVFYSGLKRYSSSNLMSSRI